MLDIDISKLNLNSLEDAKTFAAAIVEGAKDMFTSSGRVEFAGFVFVAINQAGEAYPKPKALIIEAHELKGDLEKLMGHCRFAARAGRAVGALTVAECWSVVASPEVKDLGCLPSEHPDRVEAIRVILEHKDLNGHQMMWQVPIVRTQGSTTLGPTTVIPVCAVIGPETRILGHFDSDPNFN